MAETTTTYPLLEQLSIERVFEIRCEGDGFRITEACDGYYCCDFTQQELLQLAEEIRAVALAPRQQS